MDSLPSPAKRDLNDAAIVLYVLALDQILDNQLVNHMRSRVSRVAGRVGLRELAVLGGH